MDKKIEIIILMHQKHILNSIKNEFKTRTMKVKMLDGEYLQLITNYNGNEYKTLTKLD